jgi:hypothetical protein
VLKGFVGRSVGGLVGGSVGGSEEVDGAGGVSEREGEMRVVRDTGEEEE